MSKANGSGASTAGPLQDKSFVKRAYERYQSTIYRRMRSQRFDDATAEDLTHDVFLELSKNKNPDKINNIKYYLYGIARHVVAEFLADREDYRTACEKEKNYALVEGADQLTPEVYALAQEHNERVLAMVDSLTPRQREVFLLSKFKGYGKREIAERLGISEATVVDHLYEALKFFKKEMGFSEPKRLNGIEKPKNTSKRINGCNGS